MIIGRTRANNPLERLMRKIRRRIKVVGAPGWALHPDAGRGALTARGRDRLGRETLSLHGAINKTGAAHAAQRLTGTRPPPNQFAQNSLHYLKAYRSLAEARAGLAGYFEFYNCQRRHQALDWRTPNEVYYSTLPFAAAA